MPGSISSSVQSERSSDYRLGTGTTNGSRPVSRTSYTPSYMSIPRKPTEQDRKTSALADAQARNASMASIAAEPVLSSSPPGILLVLAASGLHRSILQHLETLLTRQPFAGIVFAARREQEAELKQLKMDTYALIGKLRREVSVETQLKDSWSTTDIEAVRAEATRHGAGIQGVLCCPEYVDVVDDLDIFEVEESAMEDSWRQSVTFLHAASKVTVPHLLSRVTEVNGSASGKPAKGPRGPFFIVANSSTHTSASQIAKAASDALVRQLQAATKPKGLTVGHAESLLIPDPVRKDNVRPMLETVITEPGYSSHAPNYEFSAGESPTKLYSMWAMQEQLGYAD
ncbi:hypothetical protein CERZMDRAFT_98101 [Cercospora zeae-maydis SCOH1-5]|uniref:Uncharacterized protein n=1 Tax=Cercospora zeae-maydis SCOH1-5 TaxID=717836 RepID=A0A6A6FE47_9PEZI|nr:hypothetical protein CERZMDRAFT_98101 [Cercospora zeae-maydis SCOH1-5]